MAEGNIHFGRLKVHPYVLATHTLTDNVFAVEKLEESDRVTTTNYGLKLEFPFRRHTLFLDGGGIDTTHDKFGKDDTTDDYGSVDLNLRLGSRVALDITHDTDNGHQGRGASSTGIIDEFKESSSTASLKYQLMDISMVQVHFGQSEWDYDAKSSSFRDRDEDFIGFGLYFKVLPKTFIFLEYDTKEVAYNQVLFSAGDAAAAEIAAEIVDGVPPGTYLGSLSSSIANYKLDSKETYFFVGLKWDIKDRSTGKIAIGQVNKKYDVEPVVKNFDTVVGSIELDHRFSKSSSIELSVAKTVEEPTLGPATFVSVQRFFISTSVLAKVTHKFTSKVGAYVEYYNDQDQHRDIYSYDALSTNYLKKRKDTTVITSVGLSYEMRKWLEFVLSYSSIEKDSNIDGSSYEADETSFSVNAEF